MHRIVPMGSSYGYDLLVLVRLGTLHICAPNNRLTVAFGACWSRMHSTKAWAFEDIASHHDRTPRILICALLIRTLLLRMICLARIAESALASQMSGGLALLVQRRLGRAFVLRWCPGVLHTVQ